MIALGFIGDGYFTSETQGQLNAGQSLSVAGYSLRFDKLHGYTGEDGRDVVEAQTTLSKDGQVHQALVPRRDFFVEQQQPSTVAAVYSTAAEDAYVLLLGWDDSGKAATLKMYINPLINWTWAGGVVLILGTLVAAWSGPGAQRETSYGLRPEALQPKPAGE